MNVENREKELEAKEKEESAKIKSFSKKKKMITILKFSIMIFILVIIPLYLIFFRQDLMSDVKNTQKVIKFLEEYKGESVLIYIGIQIAQIVICVIPGQIFQFAAGYLYGFFLGLLYSIIGAALGTTITFYLARFLSRDALHLLFEEDKVEDLVRRLNSKKAYIVVFFIFLIPGVPKDLCCYAAGASDMKLKTFLIISLIGRTPAMAGSILFGIFYKSHEYSLMFALALVVAIICIFFFIKRKDVKKFFDKFYDDIS